MFTLQHGESQTERGFNINKDLLVENLHQANYLRPVVSSEAVSGRNQERTDNKLSLSKQKIQSCIRSQKTESLNAELAQKPPPFAEVNHRKSELEESVALLMKDADRYNREAEEKRDFAILSNALGFKMATSQKQSEVGTLANTI